MRGSSCMKPLSWWKTRREADAPGTKHIARSIPRRKLVLLTSNIKRATASHGLSKPSQAIQPSVELCVRLHGRVRAAWQFCYMQNSLACTQCLTLTADFNNHTLPIIACSIEDHRPKPAWSSLRPLRLRFSHQQGTPSVQDSRHTVQVALVAVVAAGVGVRVGVCVGSSSR